MLVFSCLEDVQFAGRSPHGEKFEGLMKRKIQEVWRAMAKEMEGLQSSITKKENSMENLSHEFLERWEKRHNGAGRGKGMLITEA